MVLWTIKEYIRSQQANIAEYIVDYPIYELCMEVERIPGSSRFMQWWYQDLTPEDYGDSVSKGAARELR